MKNRIAIWLVVVVAVCGWQGAKGSETRVEALRCEGIENPQGIDAAKPQLSWMLQSDERGQKQTACQILVASSMEKLAHDEGDLWDSGCVETDQSTRLPYAGKSLGSRAECFWKVRVWLALSGAEGDAHEKPTAWSSPARWTMGLLAPEDWKGVWISASKWFAPCGYGWTSLPFKTEDSPAWIRVDLGQSLPIDKVKLVALDRESFPLRFRIEAGEDFDFTTFHVVADCGAADYELGSSGTAEFPAKGLKARYVRILVLKSPVSQKSASTKGNPRKRPASDANSASKESAPKDSFQTRLRQLEVWSGGSNVALYRPTIDTGGGGNSGFVVDGMPSADMGKTCPPDACPNSQAPMLRKAFTLERPVKRAVLYYAAQGMADLSLNGARVDDTLLGPPFVDYSKRIVYRTLEVTRLLVGGPNVLGAMLGNGFFSPPSWGRGCCGGHGQPSLLAQLEVEFTDGTRQLIVSDPTWKWARSEIVANDLWLGYTEDRHLAQPGWDKPGFDDADWRAVGRVEPLGGKLCAPMGASVRVLGQLKPSRVEGDTAYFDVLSAGWPRLAIEHGKAGQVIDVQGDCGMPACHFTLAQDGPAVLEPRFIWGSGPLKLQVRGLTEPLKAEQVCIQRVGADLRPAGAFHCSNPFLNQLHEAVLRTHLNYNVDLPMDPMREKQAWTQDAEGFFNTAVYLTDVEGHYRRWWWDMADNQLPNGLLGAVVPRVRRLANDWNCPWWSGVLVWLPWEHYLYYGDRRMLEEAYEPMRQYVDFLDRLAAAGGGVKAISYYPDSRIFQDAQAAKERMLVWTGAGDWMRPADGPPDQLLNMVAWYHYAQIVSQTAAMLGKPDEAARYAAMAEDVRQRTNAKFLEPMTGLYGNNPKSQSAQILPLALGLVPEAVRPLTLQRLIDAIHAHKDHHACGFVSLTYLFQTLTETYESALANRIVNQPDYPSWKTLMHDGVLFENWHGQFAQMPACGGSVGRWLYEAVLGIRPDPAGPGFKRFILAPQPDPATGLTSAEGWYDSLYGRIVSKWKIANDTFDLEMTVPANTVATVRIPTAKPEAVMEGGRPVAQAVGVKVLRREPGALFLEVGGGRYRFKASASTETVLK
ncbi:MAG: alpha-L-rhamnosidase N-terminal domain-containing protein [Verrucomicrobiota bacterium]